MESSSTDDLEVFVSNPDGRRYWTKSKRVVISRIFRQEILDENLTVPLYKVKKSIEELGEENTPAMQNRIRLFIYRFRKDRLKVLKTGKPHSTPKRRRVKKGLVESAIPAINSSESANDDTGTDPLMPPPPGGNEIDTENDQTEANPDPDVQSLNENNELDTLECDEEETKSDPVDLSLNDKYMDLENNNEVSFSPTMNTTSCAPDMISAMKNRFAQELSASYLPSETVRVDFVTNFLKSRGFENITRETVFNWADIVSKGIFDLNPGLLFNEVTECLVKGVADGDIGWRFILESFTELSDQSSSSEELNHTKEIPLETSSSIFSDDGYNVDDLGTLDLSPIKKEVVDKLMSSENGDNMDDTEAADVSTIIEEDVDKPMPDENEGNSDDTGALDVTPTAEVVVKLTQDKNESNLDDLRAPDIYPIKEEVVDKPMPSENEGVEVHKMKLMPNKNKGTVLKMNLRTRKRKSFV